MDDRKRMVVDALIASALAVLSIALVLSVTGGSGRRAVYIVLVLAHVLPLVLRRRVPLAVLVTMVATGGGSVAVGLPVVVLGPAILVSIYTVAACCSAPTSKRATICAAVVIDRSRRANEETEVQRALAAHAASRAAAEERVRIAREH